MSACSDFAEHVWKPGSCKNCFHPLSAHHKTVGGLDVQAACLKSAPGGDEESGLTAPSPYSKPTIAVKPTMMNESVTDVNMNIEQENTKGPVEGMGLKKLLDLSSLYIDGNGCNKSRREGVLQSPETKKDFNNCFSLASLSPSILPKDSMIISNIFVTQEEVRGSQSLKKNGNGDICREQGATTTMTKSTYNGISGTARANRQESQRASAEMPFSVAVVTSSSTTVRSNGVSSAGAASKAFSTSGTTPTAALTAEPFRHNPPPPGLHSPPVLSEQSSLSDSSYQSSTDSLPGAEGSGGGRVKTESPQSPTATGSLQSAPGSPDEQLDSEPIYAQSTKIKRRPQGNGVQSHLVSPNQTKNSAKSPEPSGESHRATITIMAAHTEENRTFYLSSPDSAISTQCHFSPTARKDPSSPAFRWPSPSHSHSAPSLTPEACLSPTLCPKPQSSPPIPPKRNTRSPKLGASSLSPSISSPVPLPDLSRLGASGLSPSISSPVPLPDLSRLGASGLSTSILSPVPLPDLSRLGASGLPPSTSSPVPLPELPMLFLVSATEGHFKVQPEHHSAAVAERWHKPHHHSPGWNSRIEEEEEDDEREPKERQKRKSAAKPWTTSPVTSLVNGAAVWKEARDSKAQSGPPPMTEPGTAPPAAPNNGACQGESEGTGAEEEDKHNGSMPSKQPLHGGSSELLAAGQGAANNEPHAPPPPPKKLHRVSSKMSGSNTELDRCSRHAPAESPPPPPPARRLGSSGSTASTDNLTGDAGYRDATRLSCSSPFSRSPAASAPGSPHLPSLGSPGAEPPPLPEKKMLNRTASAPDGAKGRPLARAYPRLPFSGSEGNVGPPAASRSSLPSSPVDPRPMFSSSESLERCHAPPGRPSRSRTLDEPPKTRGRLGVHCRSSVTCSSSPQLSVPFSPSEPGPAAHLGSSMQLQTLLSNMDCREGVYSKLGGLYAESLRRLALKCEEHFTRSQRNPLRFEESNWSLFRLTSNKPSCNSGDAVYYSAACASDPSNSYAVKICKSPSVEAKQDHLYGLSVLQSMPPHFNLQQDCGHFLACVPQSMLPSDEVSLPGASASSLPQPPAPAQQVERERVVVIASEIPRHTAADFVREWAAFHKSQPEVYERRVCFLLLQLCHGLEHLKEHGVTHRDLCLENLLLVPHVPWPSKFPQQAAADNGSGSSGAESQRHLPRLLISNFAKSKRRSPEDAASTSGDPRVKRDHARLAPEILSAAQYRKFDEFQTGILIYELLHQANPFEASPALKEQDYRCEELPPIPAVSLYSAGLQQLARLLLQPDPIKRIHIQEAKRVLQSLLWGPRRDLMEQQRERRGQGVGLGDGGRHEGLLNWLDVKRALLMMKFAERSLEPERNAELEDWLCCQYFSSAHPLSLCHTAELLYSLK